MSTGGPGHTHRFDSISGWCAFCNLRDDGRLVGPGGNIFQPGREYTDVELQQLREKADSHARA